MILNYCVHGVDVREDDMAEIGEEVRRRLASLRSPVGVSENFLCGRFFAKGGGFGALCQS